MKKSFSPSKESRPSSRPSSSRPTRSNSSSRSGGSFNRSSQVRTTRPTTSRSLGADGRVRDSSALSSKETSGTSKEFFGGTPSGYGKENYGPTQRRSWRSNRTTPLVVVLVIIACCVVILCVAGVYMVSQGLLTIPSF